MNMPIGMPIGEEPPDAVTFRELILLVLDGSGSMRNLIATGERSKADDVIRNLIREETSLLERLKTGSNAAKQDIGVVTFDNHVKAIQIRPLSQVTAADLDLQLMQLHGNWTAIGLALAEAAKMAREWLQQADSNVPRFATILLFSDGGENCDSKPVEVATELQKWAAAHQKDLPRPPVLIATVAYGADADVATLKGMASPSPKDGSPMFAVATTGAALRDFFMASVHVAESAVIA